MLNATYCRVFSNVYSTAGIASFQLSPEKTWLYICSKMTATGVCGARLLETSCMENVRDIASLMTSLSRTAVEAK